MMEDNFVEAFVTGIATAMVLEIIKLFRFWKKYKSWNGFYIEYQLVQGKWDKCPFLVHVHVDYRSKLIKVTFQSKLEKETFAIFNIDSSMPSRLEAPFFQLQKDAEYPNWGTYLIEKNPIKSDDAAIIGHKSNILDERRYATASKYATISGESFTPQPMNYKRIKWKKITIPPSFEQYSDSPQA